MKNTRKTAFSCLFLLAGVMAWVIPCQSQMPSPPAKAACKFSDAKTITINYSSPRMRGRQIFGGLVPYGEVWRAGANQATTFVIDTAVTLGGKTVPAGSY